MKLIASLLLAVVAIPAVIGVSACSTSKISPADEAALGPKRKILPPPGSPMAQKEADRSAIDRLLSDLPDDAKGSGSEIVLPADAPGLEDESGALSAEERKRREIRAARTDNELVRTSRSFDERQSKDVGAIDRDLGVMPSEKASQPPSYILTLQKIRALFKAHQYEDGLIETNEALRSYPKSAQLLTMKGTLHQRMNQMDLALVSYERAYSIEPTRKLQAQIEYLRDLLADRNTLQQKQAEQSPQTSTKGGQ